MTALHMLGKVRHMELSSDFKGKCNFVKHLISTTSTCKPVLLCFCYYLVSWLCLLLILSCVMLFTLLPLSSVFVLN